MEILLTEGMAKLYEKMDELKASQLLKLVQISANYVIPKAKLTGFFSGKLGVGKGKVHEKMTAGCSHF
jgi:hypothetical protein